MRGMPMIKFCVSLVLLVALAPCAEGQMLPAVPKPAPQDSAPPATPAAQETTSTGQVSADYVIGPGDSLSVNVWKEPTISGTFPVRPDGMISLQLIHDIQASGRTPTQLSGDITEKLKHFINDPLVTVSVQSVTSKQIFLSGEVARPGPVQLTPGLNPLQAIASAGGLTLYAKSKNIYILRGSGGNQQKIRFNYKAALKTGNLQGVTLVAGDLIVVP